MKGKLPLDRRSFLKISAAAGGGIVLGFSWASCKNPQDINKLSQNWNDVNAYLKIAEDGSVTIMSPNPEIGQNVKTSMPMIVAEELDCDWNDVIVEQAPLDTGKYNRQVAGGSQSIRQGWHSLRTAGATAKAMLIAAAAKQWEVNPSECSVAEGIISGPDKQSFHFGEVAALANQLDIPAEVQLKNPADFKIIGQDKRNVDMEGILSGQPMYGMDIDEENMVYAVVVRPPAFGKILDSFDANKTKELKGIIAVFEFGNKIAVVAHNTWTAMKGAKLLKATWSDDSTLESTADHNAVMLKLLDSKSEEPKRSDGQVKSAFSNADELVEAVYEAPFLPHNCLEPMNFFADVQEDKVYLKGPIQTPKGKRESVAEMLGRKEEDITLEMTRMGGGFGRRLYGDFADEAVAISNKIKRPVKLTYSREDDMTAGIYRPASKYKFRASIKNGNVSGYHLTGVGINMWNSTRQNNFPATGLEHYLVESHSLKSNITTGAWRAPVSNFLAFAEQSFWDELAIKIGKDPIQLRLDVLQNAKSNPVGELHYDIDKSIGVIQLAAEKSKWGKTAKGVYQGFSTYYSHNTYVAEVADVVLEGNQVVLKKITCAIDCGIVINPRAARNQVEGGIIDGLGHAMFGDFSFEAGRPNHNNFNTYRMIRMGEIPEIETHFVESYNDPTGLGEPTLPPAAAALANAVYAATGKRFYKQPFVTGPGMLG